ncbi:proton-dependent oligopeptide transporter, POT family [Chitinophaga sp. YR573]|uniref:peptide MFS transporter n=1 Tax=Chitinophaga sp. YR573 TaxID=1881040 RepID=UPI0008CAE998|nr:peptide MFS transporter [Chitinophaga sp. YR573]SEW06291.1 proton-dependent oligopeptide transporter, POT family [Chitinophaga sp. YR573]
MSLTAAQQPVITPNNTPPKAGHHPGLYVLFFTEMWERFGYYLMIGIFFLYLIDPTANGGKGFDTAHAGDLVGSYIALVYLSPFIGGLMADRYLGYRRAVIFGGALLAAGYFGLAFPGDTAMYISLGLIIIGNGFFKPNIGTILGNIYNREDLRPKKDVAYNIFYMGVNIGAFICNFVAAYLRNHYGWGHAFVAAGIGMVVGLIIFSSRLKVIAEGDIRKPIQKEDMPTSRILGLVLLPAALAAALGYFMAEPRLLGHSIFGTRSIDAFMFACVPIIIFYISLYKTAATHEDKRGLGALLAFFVVAIIFWVIYNQNSTGLTIWANQYTDRHMSPAIENAAKPLGMLQTVTTDPHTITQVDQHFKAVADASGKTMTTQGPDLYFQNLPKEQWPPSGKMNLISTEIFQSINPFFIVALSLLMIGLFAWMAKRGKEPTTPVKIAFGIFFAGLSALLMVFAAASTNVYIDKTSMAWLFGTYAVFTVGEIMVSPIGLSMVSKLSPPRVTALMMGGWYLVNAIAGKIAGMMATFWDSFTDKKSYFMILVVSAAIAGTVMLILSKWIAKVVKDKTGSY